MTEKVIFFFIKEVNVKNNDIEKIDELDWFTLDKLPNPLCTGFQFTYNRYLKKFHKYK